jgi:predicted MFS family arabinose efflux permease
MAAKPPHCKGESMIAAILNVSAFALTLYLAVSKERWQPVLIWLAFMIAVVNMIPIWVLPEGDERLALSAANSVMHIGVAIIGRIVWALRRSKNQP